MAAEKPVVVDDSSVTDDSGGGRGEAGRIAAVDSAGGIKLAGSVVGLIIVDEELSEEEKRGAIEDEDEGGEEVVVGDEMAGGEADGREEENGGIEEGGEKLEDCEIVVVPVENEKVENGGLLVEKENRVACGEEMEVDTGEKEEYAGLCEEEKGGIGEGDEDGRMVVVPVENGKVYREKKTVGRETCEEEVENGVLSAEKENRELCGEEMEVEEENVGLDEEGGIGEEGEKLEGDEDRCERKTVVVPIEKKAEGREACEKEENGGFLVEKENLEPRGEETEVDAGMKGESIELDDGEFKAEKLEVDESCSKEENVGLDERVCEEEEVIGEEGEKLEGDEDSHEPKMVVVPFENGDIHDKKKAEGRETCEKEENGVLLVEKENLEPHGEETEVDGGKKEESIGLDGREFKAEKLEVDESCSKEENVGLDERLCEEEGVIGEEGEKLEGDEDSHEHKMVVVPIENGDIHDKKKAEGRETCEKEENGVLLVEKENLEPRGEETEVDGGKKEESIGLDDREFKKTNTCEEKGGNEEEADKLEGDESCSKGDVMYSSLDNGHAYSEDSSAEVNDTVDYKVSYAAELQSAVVTEANMESSTVVFGTRHGPDPEAVVVEEEQEPEVMLAGITNSAAKEVKQHSCFVIKVPRFSDDKLLKELKEAKKQLNEKTQIRDSIRTARSSQKYIVKELDKKVKTVIEEEKITKDAKSTREKEFSDVKSMIGKMREANSIRDIDNDIYIKEHKIQHETMDLKQEKQHINDIKKLKQHRSHLLSNLGSQAEMQKTFDQKDQIEERFQVLRNEIDSLKTELSLAQVRVKAVLKERDDERKRLADLVEKDNDASYVQEKANSHFVKVLNDLQEKNRYYYKYKDDQTAANNYSFLEEKEMLRIHCSNKVEEVMDLWNNNDEFRKQYIKFNERSTLKRLRTLDGRSLGPGEEPPVLHSGMEKSPTKVSLSSSTAATSVPTSSHGTTQENSGMLPLPEKKDVLPSSKVAQMDQIGKKKLGKPTSKVVPTILPSKWEEEEEGEEEANIPKKLTEEEEELARKEEKLRKEKAAADLHERLRLEQRIKFKDAEERKKRRAEKAQAKAEYKAQKEAEEREKRRAKKEKMKAESMGINGCVEGDDASNSVTNPPHITQELETKTHTTTKRPSKPSPALKKIKEIQPVPLPLRRNKKKMKTWMWALLITFLVLVLFFSGNYISSSKFVMPNFGI